MALRVARREAYLETVWAISASQYVEQYVIGFTYRPGIARYREYRALGYDHLVIIADRLSRKDALDLEHYLQRAVREDRRSVMYRKYHAPRRSKPTYRSYGGGDTDPNALVHSVYMAWWEP
jgi:hypothetical protein